MQYTLKKRIDAQGRIVIPKEIREELGINLGDAIKVRNTDNAVELYPIEHFCVICGKPTNHKRNLVYVCPECVAKLVN